MGVLKHKEKRNWVKFSFKLPSSGYTDRPLYFARCSISAQHRQGLISESRASNSMHLGILTLNAVVGLSV